MKSNKGFTLVELLAVIVILAVIALIAVPIILNIVEKARQASAADSALGYVDAIEKQISLGTLQNKVYLEKDDYLFDEIAVDVKGDKPIGGTYELKKNRIVQGIFCINNYAVEYENNIAQVTGSCDEHNIKKTSKITLSQTTGSLVYPGFLEFEVTENSSGGALSCKSSDDEIATCSISDNVVKVVAGTKEGRANITIISAETEKFRETKSVFVLLGSNGKLTINVPNTEFVYDGQPHSLDLSSVNYTVKYGETAGTYDLDESPIIINAGTKEVFYQITKPGYTTITGSKVITIKKADGIVNAPTAANIRENGTAQNLINAGSTTTGIIEYKLENGEYSTSIPQVTAAGTYTVYYRVIGDENHKDIEERSIIVTVKKADYTITHTCNSYPSTCNFSAYPLNGALSSGAYLKGTKVQCVCWYDGSSAKSYDYQSITACPNGGTASKVSGGKPNGPNSNRQITIKCTF